MTRLVPALASPSLDPRGETPDAFRAAIRTLPGAQQQVIVLRDVEGWSAEEACDLLQLREANQRILLHRARSKVRQALESHLEYAFA